MTTSIHAVVVDDDVPTRIGLSAILSSDAGIEVVGEADTGVEGLRLVRDLAPDVAIVDVHLPDLDGIELTRRISAAGSTKVIVMTAFAIDNLAYSSMQAGASGFLLKRTSVEDLIHSVHAVASGEELLLPRLTTELISSSVAVSEAPREVFQPPLTVREAEILVELAHGSSNVQIADHLHLSIETVRTHVKHIYMKAGARDRAQAVIAAYESGMVGRRRH